MSPSVSAQLAAARDRGQLIIVSTTAYAGGVYGTGYTEDELAAFLHRPRAGQ